MNLRDFFKKYKTQSKKGFTLVEMIATICVISITSTAILSVFLMVRDTIESTGDITSNQHSSGQVERFIRNEFQVASGVDAYVADSSFNPTGCTLAKDDEWMVYDSGAKCVYFKKVVDDAGTIQTLLTIDNVWSVHVEIKPLNQTIDPAAAVGTKVKMIYTIETESKEYTYSGGIVLGNSSYNRTDLTTGDIDLIWDEANSAGVNDILIKFHSEVPYTAPTPP